MELKLDELTIATSNFSFKTAYKNIIQYVDDEELKYNFMNKKYGNNFSASLLIENNKIVEDIEFLYEYYIRNSFLYCENRSDYYKTEIINTIEEFQIERKEDYFNYDWRRE
jgi:hypothetical protein